MLNLLALRTGAVALVLTLASACGGADRGGADTAGGSTSAVAAGGDTSMAGMGHSTMPGMNRPPAKDADQEFLRMMVDHHEGLILMASAAMTKATRSEAKADAHQLHQKQEQERDRMAGMLRSVYNDSSIAPMVAPKYRAMNDSLQQKSGAEYDRTFYRDLVMHHRDAVQMVDQFLPRLRNPQVRQMAEQMRRDQTREIAEFEKKASG